MKLRWYCKRCDRNCEIHNNLRIIQESMVIKKVQVECSAGHTKILDVSASQLELEVGRD